MRLLLSLFAITLAAAFDEQAPVVVDVGYSEFTRDKPRALLYARAFEAGMAGALNISSEQVHVHSAEETRTQSTRVRFFLLETAASDAPLVSLFERCDPYGGPPVGCLARMDLIVSLRSTGLPVKLAFYAQEGKEHL